MKNALLLLALPFFVATLPAQTAVLIQNSMVREQNSNKRPISGTQVIFEDAVPAASGQDGLVRLAFQNRKPGSYTFLTEVTKPGYELVNKTELEHLKLSDTDQLGNDIIMAKAGVVDAAKKEYYGISDKALLAGFEKEKRRLRNELNDTKLSEQPFEQQFKQVQEQYNLQKKELDALSEKFARVNFDDVDNLYRESLELFKAGKIDEAIQKLESADPVKLIEQIIGQEKQDADDEKKLAARKQATAKTKQGIIAQVRLLADMYSVKFNPAKAESLFDGLLRLDSTDLSILLDAAIFYRQNHRYEKALHILPLIIAHPQAEDWQKANAYSHTGEIYTNTGRLADALGAFEQVEKRYAAFLNSQPTSPNFMHGLAISYEKLGETHTWLGNLDTALTFFEKDIELSKELYEAFPQNADFKYGLAISYSKLGETYTAIGNLDTAMIFYEADTRLFEELYEAFPQNADFKSGLAISYSKLGETHTRLGNLDKALPFFEQYNQLEKELHLAFPQNVGFKDGLAISYEKCGASNLALRNLDKALSFFEQYNQLEKELYADYPSNVDFKKDLAISCERLGDTHIALGNLDKALTFFEGETTLFEELYEAFPENVEFKKGLAIAYSILGERHTALGNLDKAVFFYEKDIGLSKELYETWSKNVSFKNGLAISYYNLGEFSRDRLKENAKCKTFFQQAEKLWVELVRDAPQYAQFQECLGIVRKDLSGLE